MTAIPQTARRSLFQGVWEDDAPTGITALVGGGGKTTLMFALAAAAARRGRQVICTTTTRMGPPLLPPHPQAQCRAFLTAAPEAIVDAVRAASEGDAALLLVAREFVALGEKVAGFAPEVVDRLAEAFPDRVILVEADGSAGRPLKSPSPYEPVFPAATRRAVALVGLCVAGRPLSEATTHRLTYACAATGLAPGAPATPDVLACLSSHPHGFFQHCPAAARRVVFCNQADLPDALDFAASAARRAAGSARWLAGSAQQDWCVPLPRQKRAAWA